MKKDNVSISNKNSILSLPNEVLALIFNNLDYKSFVSLDLVCRAFLGFSEEPIFWKNQINIFFSYLKERESIEFHTNPKSLFISEYLRYKNDEATNWHIGMSQIMRILKDDVSFLAQLPHTEYRNRLISLALSVGSENILIVLDNLRFFSADLSQYNLMKNECKREALKISTKRGNLSITLKFLNSPFADFLDFEDFLQISFTSAKHDQRVIFEMLIKRFPFGPETAEICKQWLAGALEADNIEASKMVVNNYNSIFYSTGILDNSLHVAIKQNLTYKVQLLLENISSSKFSHYTLSFALQDSVKNNQLDIVKILLKSCKSRIFISYKNNALIYAAFHSEFQLFALLFSSFKDEISRWDKIKAVLGIVLHNLYFVYIKLKLFIVLAIIAFNIFAMVNLSIARLSLILINKVGIFILVLEGMLRFRDFFKAQQYQGYKSKKDADLDKLTDTQLDAFNLGVKSANNVYNQFLSFGAWDTYCSPRAYYAGYQAQKKENVKLISNVLRRRK